MNEISFTSIKKINVKLTQREKSICHSSLKKNSTIQLPPNNKSARNELHEQNQFHEEKNQHATSFTNKNQNATSSTNKNQPLTTSSIKKINFHEEKNQCINFMKRKINLQQVSRTKNKQATNSMNKISFVRRKKYNFQVSPIEKSI